MMIPLTLKTYPLPYAYILVQSTYPVTILVKWLFVFCWEGVWLSPGEMADFYVFPERSNPWGSHNKGVSYANELH